MAEKQTQPKRLNRTVGVAEALGKALDPALKRRGFATRDIVTHWAAMAPAPYDRVTQPDKLVWPRGGDGAGGAVLHLRCADAHRLALAHEGDKVAAAINRYFGYLLIREVRLAATPFSPGSAEKPEILRQASPEAQAKLEGTLSKVEDPGLKEALRRLGEGVLTKPKAKRQR